MDPGDERWGGDIPRWLLEAAPDFPHTRHMLGELVARLNTADFRIIRSNIYTGTLHPQVASTLNVWRRGDGFIETSKTAVVVGAHEERHGEGILKEIYLGHRQKMNPAYRASPIHAVIEGGRPEVRERLRARANQPFPIFSDFVEAGGTDYCAFGLPLSEGKRGCHSWLTARPGGFEREQVELLRLLAPIVALLVDVQSARHVRETLLSTYLGRHPGDRVREGKIRQGDVERIEAAIWFSDLRGFTGHSVRLPPEELVELLNRYFGAVGVAIQQRGGEILKFIGDAILAIFPVDDEHDAEAACSAALEAADAAQAALAELNAESGAQPLETGVALNLGEVQYGNIGTEERLDFTVIGQAVNLASRIEGLCGKLRYPLLLSERFADAIDRPTEAVGEFELKGIPGLQVVHRLA